MVPSGLLNIYKPKEYTSFDCVAILRKKLGIKKIGHTGTLDPMAEGVLAVCVGKATRIIEYLEQDTKAYEGVLRLGQVTDTCDIYGETLSKAEADVSEEEISAAFQGFRGEIRQTPPMYAAIKVDGKKLYEYAREGKDVEVPQRTVTVLDLQIKDIFPKAEDGTRDVAFAVECSRGFYVRSLCRDIGEVLGCGGTMAALTRTRSGAFRAEDGLSIEDVKTMGSEELRKRLLPMDKALEGMPVLDAGEETAADLANGKHLAEERFMGSLPVEGEGDLLRMYYDGHFFGIASYDRENGVIHGEKILDPDVTARR